MITGQQFPKENRSTRQARSLCSLYPQTRKWRLNKWEEALRVTQEQLVSNATGEQAAQQENQSITDQPQIVA
jgi:hypothetical protein